MRPRTTSARATSWSTPRPLIFGKKVLLPAGVVDRIDAVAETIYVNRTKDQIKDSPEFDESNYQDVGYRSEVGSYYGPEGRGYTD